MGQLDSIGQPPVLGLLEWSYLGLLTVHIDIVLFHKPAKLGEPSRSIYLLHVVQQGTIRSMEAGRFEGGEGSELLRMKQRTMFWSRSRKHESKSVR